jgi:hypothetical protein
MLISIRSLVAAVGVTGVLAISAPDYAKANLQATPQKEATATSQSQTPQASATPAQPILVSDANETRELSAPQPGATAQPILETPAATPAVSTRIPMFSKIFPCASMQQ